MRTYSTICFVACLIFSAQLGAQNRQNQESYRLNLKRTGEKVELDGELNEAIWQTAAVAGDFWMSFPVDDRRADPEIQTEVRMTYDEQYLYLGIVCHGDDDYIIQTLKRDTDFWDGDAFALVIDPVNQASTGFIFGVNPLGVQTESLIAGQIGRRGSGSARNINAAWDNKWFSAVQSYPDRWTIEIAIPFKTLRFKSENTVWGINFVRGDKKTNSYHTWAPVPVQFRGVDLGYTGALVWDQAPAKVRNNISLIPYVLGGTNRDYEDNTDWDPRFSTGLDAKVAITSSLNLDLTVNPDFSQVEVDQQVTNLTRFNVRFPERRLFFLENSDIFSDFGIPPMRPFFSRRIGLDENAQPIPILYGARLSGNLQQNLRVGLMNLQTRESESGPARNFTSFAFQQRIWSRSVLKGYFHNSMALGAEKETVEAFNRSAGLEFDYLSKDGKWQAFTGYGHAFRPTGSEDSYFYKVGTGYNGRNFSFYTNFSGIGENYYADVGFIPSMTHYDAERDTSIRLGFHHAFTRMSYTIYPENQPRIIAHVFSGRNVADMTHGQIFFNNSNSLAYRLQMRNTSSFEIEYNWNRQRLLFPFTFTGETPLEAGVYQYQSGEVSYTSDQRKRFGYEAGVSHGSFYNGMRTQYRLGFSYRAQPWGNFALNFVRNDLTFPDPYGEEQLFLISPRIEINFSRSIFWTTFLQYNTQADNFNLNTRLQWRFQPMSDLFIVYTDNYAVDFWGPKNRALVLKLNYWLNL